MQKNLDDFYLFGSTNKDLITDDEIKNYNLIKIIIRSGTNLTVLQKSVSYHYY